MNIKTNEILLLNKIKLEGDKNTNTATLDPIADEASAEKGMKALMFQGMKTLLTNPNFAKETGVGEDIEIKQQDENAKEYVAPFKSNLAFGNKSKFMQTGAKYVAGMMLATTAAAPVLTACSPKYPETIVTQTVNIDFSELITILSQLMSKYDAKTDEQIKLLQQLQQTQLEVLEAIRNGNMDMNDGFQLLFNQFVETKENQGLILAQLVANGMSQDDANKLLKDLIKEVRDGNMTAQEAWAEISAKLDVTNNYLKNIYETMKASFENLFAQHDAIITLTAGILDNTDKTNEKLDQLTKDLNQNANSILVEIGNAIISNETVGASIQETITNSGILVASTVEENIAALAEGLNMSISEFKSSMIMMGISHEELMKMSVLELLEAIDNQTSEIKNVKTAVYQAIAEYQAGRLTAEQFAQKMLDAMNLMNSTLSGIDNKLDNLYSFIVNAYAQVQADLIAIKNNTANIDAKAGDMSKQLNTIIDGQKTIVNTINTAVQNGVISINDNAYTIAAKLAQQLNMSVSDLMSLLKTMNISNQDLLKMSVQDLLNAINKNTEKVAKIQATFESYYNMYINTQITAQQFAEKIVELLGSIDGKLDAVIAALNDNLAALKAGIAKIEQSLNSNTQTIVTTLNANKDEISEQINNVYEGLQGAINKLNNSVNEGVISINANASTNADKIAAQLGMSTAQLMSFLEKLNISNQKLMTMSVQELLTALQKQTNEIAQIKTTFNTFLAKYEAGQITAKEFAQMIVNLLGEISEKLDGISAQITQFYNDAMKALKDANTTLVSIDNKTTITNTYLYKMNVNIEAAREAQESYKAQLAQLIELAKDNNTYNSEILAELQSQPAKYQDMLNRLGISLTQALNMTASQFRALVENAMANYDATEGKQTQLLENIYNALKNFEGQTIDNSDVVAAINALRALLSSTLNADAAAINAKLQAILDALAEISAKLDGISAQMTQFYNDVMNALKTANTTLASIDGKTTITNNYLNKLNLNVEAVKAAQESYKAQLAQLIELAKDNNTYNSEILAELKSQPAKYQEMLNKLGISINQAINMSAAEFRALVEKAMANYDATEGKQTQLLADIYNALKNFEGGTIDNTGVINAINALKAALTSTLNADTAAINAKLQAILDALAEISAKLDDISAKITDGFNKVIENQKQANELIASIDRKTTITNNYLNKLNLNVEAVKDAQESYKAELAQLIELAKDNNTYNSEILAELKSHPEKYQEMLDKLGISINQAINMSAAQFRALVEKAMANYDQTEGKQTQLLTDIYNALKNFEGGTIDNTGVIEAINALKAALTSTLNADTAAINAKLQAILDALGNISDQLDDLLNEVRAISANIQQMNTYLSNFDNYWTQALNKLGDYAEDLAEIKALLREGNANTAQINAKMKEVQQTLEAMKAAQARAEAFLNGILTNSQIIIDKLGQFENVDYDKLESIMQGISDNDYQRYSALLKSLAIDPSQFESVKELIEAIKNSVADIQKDTKYGKMIYDILKDVDWTKPECAAKIDQVIEILNNLKITCQCNCHGGDPDEGGHNVDDLDDLING